MERWKALIVDDESLARQVVKRYLNDRADIEIAGECSDGFECLKFFSTQKADLLFLDIQMPRITGFELLEVLQEKPQIVFTTAFDAYALKAFEMNAVDYLLKPYSRERFNEAVDKCIERLKTGRSEHAGVEKMIRENTAPVDDRIVVRQGNKVVVLPLSEIHYFESSENYVCIHSPQGNYMKERTMKYYEEQLKDHSFIRLHRSYLVNLMSVSSIEPYTKDSYIATLKNGEKIRVSQEGYARFREKMK